MARIRTIKPEFWQDEKMVRLPDAARLIFLGLVSLADDAGRLLDKPVKIEADLFDGEQDRRRDVLESLANLSRIGVIRRGFTASGQRIIEITNWTIYQRVDHPNYAAAFPEIITPLEDSDIRETFASDSRDIREGFAHHTNDLRPVPTTSTNDLSAPRKRRAPKPAAAKKYPEFAQEDRARCIAAFRRLGAVDVNRLIPALAPLYRPASDPDHVPHQWVTLGVEDYCALVPRGKSAPFASPQDCAKKLMTLARNCQRYEEAHDPVGRHDANMVAIHGWVQKVAA